MTHARRDESTTPDAEARTFRDGEGRQWAGSVMSGRLGGGEENAEVVFVCEDVPSEPKRTARLDASAERATQKWRSMDEEQMRALLRASEPA